MQRLMQGADLAISGAGVTLYELAATGTPTVAVADGATTRRPTPRPSATRARPLLRRTTPRRRVCPRRWPTRWAAWSRARRTGPASPAARATWSTGAGAIRAAREIGGRIGSDDGPVMDAIEIGGRRVGAGEPCFVIAEAGANHNRSLAMGRELIDAAAEAGADAVKFQTYSAETLYSRRRRASRTWRGSATRTPWDLIKEIELPREWQADLSAYAARRGIPFFSSPFDHARWTSSTRSACPRSRSPPSRSWTCRSSVTPPPRAGRSSCPPAWPRWRRSTTRSACRAAGDEQVALLQCASLYPAPPGVMNLRAMETMRRAFGVPVGLSDHTCGIHVAVAAAGARGRARREALHARPRAPRARSSVRGGAWRAAAMVSQIREVEAALGDGRKRGPAPEEMEMHERPAGASWPRASSPAGRRDRART